MKRIIDGRRLEILKESLAEFGGQRLQGEQNESSSFRDWLIGCGGIVLLWWSVVQGTDHDPFYQPYHYEHQVVPSDPPKIYSV